MPTGKLQVIPLGGLGEFGMNCMAVRWGDDIIVIDAGLMFPEAELLGVDIVVPDITYLIENRQRVRGMRRNRLQIVIALHQFTPSTLFVKRTTTGFFASSARISAPVKISFTSSARRST